MVQNGNYGIGIAQALTDLHRGVTGVTYIPECSLKINATSSVSKGFMYRTDV